MLRKAKAPAEVLADRGRGKEIFKRRDEIDNKGPGRRQHLSNAWCRVLNAIAEQREALDFRIWCARPDDTDLDADVQIWCELSAALADFLDARVAA
jgi:hypothetical protein